MTSVQKTIKHLAMAFAIFLSISIIVFILRLVGLINVFSVGNATDKELKSYTVSEQITSLRVDVNAAEINISSSNSFSVESNLKKLKVKERNGTLTIQDEKNTGLGYKDAVLNLCIPENFIFNNIYINTGAGKLTVDTLSADKLVLDLGAGKVDIFELNAVVQSEIDTGAGAVKIRGGSLCNLDLDMGVGEFSITSAILGNSELNYGIGQANLTLLGTQDDYSVKFDKGIGSIKVEGESIKDSTVLGNGINRINIDSGIGEVNIKFKAN